jgi:hypothetical protein
MNIKQWQEKNPIPYICTLPSPHPPIKQPLLALTCALLLKVTLTLFSPASCLHLVRQKTFVLFSSMKNYCFCCFRVYLICLVAKMTWERGRGLFGFFFFFLFWIFSFLAMGMQNYCDIARLQIFLQWLICLFPEKVWDLNRFYWLAYCFEWFKKWF